jgi:hypothetical protein
VSLDTLASHSAPNDSDSFQFKEVDLVKNLPSHQDAAAARGSMTATGVLTVLIVTMLVICRGKLTWGTAAAVTR